MSAKDKAVGAMLAMQHRAEKEARESLGREPAIDPDMLDTIIHSDKNGRREVRRYQN